jgi:hypothetical protein
MMTGIDTQVRQLIQHEVARQVGQAFTALGASLRTIGTSLKRTRRQTITVPRLPRKRRARRADAESRVREITEPREQTVPRPRKPRARKQPMTPEPQQAELVRD